MAAAGRGGAGRRAGEPPVADGAPRPGSGRPGGDDLSYPARLGKNAARRTAEARAAPGDAALRAAGAARGAGRPIPLPPAAAGAADSAPPAALQPGNYTVQVAAVKRREEADAIVKRLKAKGYDAYVFVPDPATSPSA